MKNLQLLLILLLAVPTAYAAGLEVKEKRSKEEAFAEYQANANAALMKAVHAFLEEPLVLEIRSGWVIDTVQDPAILDALLKDIKGALQQGADIIMLDTNKGFQLEPGDTILHIIIHHGLNQPSKMNKLIQFLLKEQVIHARELNVTNSLGITPFELAVRTMPLQIIKDFIVLGADINVIDKKGKTPLYAVIARQTPDYGYKVDPRIDIVRLLVKPGTNVNHVDVKGKTALMYAAEKGHSDIVSFLLEHGADPLLIDNNGYDAYWYAQYKAPAGKESEQILALLKPYKEQLRKNMAAVPHPLFQIRDLSEGIIGEYATEPTEENEYSTKAMFYGESSDEE